MIVLASTSATRQAMLRSAGLSFASAVPQVDEPALVARRTEWAPQDIAVKLAEAKAIDVSERHPGAIVIGADQVLALGTKVYSKPRDVAQCREQLIELRGKTHALISGVVTARDGKTCWSCRDEALLTMRNFSDGFLDHYLERTGADCTTSVGGYKIEGLGVQLFETIKGDHFTILGLPLIALLQHLREAGEVAS